MTKPGIIRGNLLAAAAGFMLASGRDIEPARLLALLVGLGLIIGASCVANNYLDRSVDRKMERTHGRALVTGEISVKNASLYCLALLAAGSVVLGVFTNSLALWIAWAGVIFYVAVYGIVKRLSWLGTLVGSISGAIPPLAGYAAAAGKLEPAAWILFVILIAWQMPHFYAIAIYRLEDYKKAGIPVLPAVKGIPATKNQIFFFVQTYLFATLALSVLGYTGYVYFGVSSAIGIAWVVLAMRGLRTRNDDRWARGMFKYSLGALSLLCLTIYFDGFLP